MLPNLNIVYDTGDKNVDGSPREIIFKTINKFLKYLEFNTSFPGLFEYESNNNFYRWTVEYNVEHTSFAFIRLFDYTTRSISSQVINVDSQLDEDIKTETISNIKLKKLLSLQSSSEINVPLSKNLTWEEYLILQNQQTTQITNNINTIPTLVLIDPATLQYSIEQIPFPQNITWQEYINLQNKPPFYYLSPGTSTQLNNSLLSVNPSTSGIVLNQQDDFNYLRLFLNNFNRSYNNTNIWYVYDNGKTGTHKKEIKKWFGYDGINNILFPPTDNLKDVLQAILVYWWQPANYDRLTIIEI